MKRRFYDPDHCTACGDFLPCGQSWIKGHAITNPNPLPPLRDHGPETHPADLGETA